MKNKTQLLDQYSQLRIPDWLFMETQEYDFLIGKTPMDLGDDTWEEEE
jgi:hypothetical protein